MTKIKINIYGELIAEKGWRLVDIDGVPHLEIDGDYYTPLVQWHKLTRLTRDAEGEMVEMESTALYQCEESDEIDNKLNALDVLEVDMTGPKRQTIQVIIDKSTVSLV